MVSQAGTFCIYIAIVQRLVEGMGFLESGTIGAKFARAERQLGKNTEDTVRPARSRSLTIVIATQRYTRTVSGGANPQWRRIPPLSRRPGCG